jgi:hypothetical protein
MKTEEATLVETIHNEFKLALGTACSKMVSIGDRLREELTVLVVDDEYASLRTFFGGTEEVTKAISLRVKADTMNATKAGIDQFVAELNKIMMRLPYKLINYTSVDALCSKYGLVIGKSSLYKQALPKENAKEIANAVKSFPMDLWGKTDDAPLFVDTFKRPSEHKARFESNMYIAAPVNYFNTKGQCRVGNELFKSPVEGAKVTLSPVPPPDPIALVPVRFESDLGKDLRIFAIISAWGIEAKDPKVYNVKLN